MNHFCIIVNQEKDDSMEKAYWIRNSIHKRGGIAEILPARREGKIAGEGYTDVSRLMPETEAALILGGDGTVIQAARELAAYELPLVGINLGTMGFLTEIEMNQAEEALDQLFTDQYQVEKRLMLSGKVWKAEKEVYKGQALNDIVISRIGYSRIISMKVSVNGQLLTNYRGDGVVVSTPTGSTAYNLSAGGPVILPETQAYVITPICVHSWEMRSVVVPQEDEIKIEIMQSKKSQKEEAVASFDGNNGILLETGDVVEIRKACQQTRFLKLFRKGIMENLRDKMRNGEQV